MRRCYGSVGIRGNVYYGRSFNILRGDGGSWDGFGHPQENGDGTSYLQYLLQDDSDPEDGGYPLRDWYEDLQTQG